MTATCYPTPKIVAQEMLQGVVHATCDRQGETPAQRDARSRSVVHSVLAFEPRDPVEVMLAGMVVTHFHLILDSAHDAYDAAPDNRKARINSGINGLGRQMGGFLKELQSAQLRPLAAAAAPSTDAPAEKPAPKPPPAARKTQTPAADWRDAAPVPLLPPLRTASTSDIAMLAVITPPIKPRVVNRVRSEPPGTGVNPEAG